MIDDQGYALPDDFTITVRIDDSGPNPSGPYYEMSLKRNPDGTLQTVNMDDNEVETLKRKGISAALLREISSLLGEDIVSSPEFKDMANRRSPKATKVWEHLVREGVAEREGDRFRLHNDRL